MKIALKKLKMPAPKGAKDEVSELDMGAEDAEDQAEMSPDESEQEPVDGEEMAEADADQAASPLEGASDEDLLAELQKRGLVDQLGKHSAEPRGEQDELEYID